MFAASQPSFVLPDGIEPLDVRLGDAAAFRGFTLKQSDPQDVTLFWEALHRGPDYRHFIHLMNPTTGEDCGPARCHAG